MLYLLLRRYRAYISAMGRHLKGLPMRTSRCGFLCTALILLCAAVAGLLFYNQKARKQGSEVAPVVADTSHSSEPKSPEITKPGALELLLLAMMERLQQENTRHEDPASDHGPQEANEEIERGSTQNAAEKQEPAVGHHEGVLYLEDGRFLAPVEEEHERTEVDLVRCIAELERAEPAQMEQAIRDLWIIAADVGIPEEALEALEYLVMQNHDPEVIKLAEFALADLRHLIEMQEKALTHPPSSADSSEQDQAGNWDEISAGDGSEAGLQGEPESPLAERSEQSAIFQARLEELKEQALLDPNEASRKDAIHTLANYRSEAAVDVLIEAAMDTDAGNRYEAVEALWFSAADGLDKDTKIQLCLQDALGDSDERVVELAAKALADLDHLEVASEEETALPSKEELTLDLPMYNEDGSSTLRD